MRQIHKLCLLIASLCLWCFPQSANAWSSFVHELICEMAFLQLSPNAQKEVRRLSSGDNAAKGYRGFPESCVWADEVRSTTHIGTSEYHYTNVPRDAKGYDYEANCAAFDCVEQASIRYLKYLHNVKNFPDKRAEALRFLAHFVPDLHQPLHVGFGEDKGGNDLRVSYAPGFRPDNRLHGTWDGELPKRAGLLVTTKDRTRDRDRYVLAQEQVALISEEDRAQWSTPNIAQWASESHELARACAYRIECDESKDYLENGATLSRQYWKAAQPVVLRRVRMASVRLAYYLELASSSEPLPSDLLAP
ncbi:MAG: S1/P1 nuclease [Pseudomonadota bacterium]